MRPIRLFTDKAALIQALCGVCCVAGILCLMSGAFIAVGTLEHSLLLWACLGAALLLCGVFLIEFSIWFDAKKGNRGEQESAVGRGRALTATEEIIQAAVMQALIVMLFGLLLDGHVRMTACFYSCLGYWPGALLVIARRGRAPTWGDRIYLRWGWLPILVISTVLFLRVWKSKGLI